MRTLLCLSSVSLLTACDGFSFGDPVDVRFPPPPSLTAPCAAPVVLPSRTLSDRDVELLWGRDRGALRECGSRHAGLKEWAVD